MRRLLCAMWFVTIVASSQMQHAPDGGSREMLQSIDVPTKAGAPFTAHVATSWKRRLEDGTEFTVYNRRTVARDSTGRVFQERRYLSPDGNTQPTQVSQFDYWDPSLKTVTVCTPGTRQCMVRHWKSMPVAGDPPQLPASQTLPNGAKITRESLGQNTIDTLQVTGTREVSTGPQFGAAEPSVRELWYSPRLGLNLVVKRFLPRGGAEDFSVENINQNEPDASLFNLPKGYQVVDVPAPQPVQGRGAQ